MIVNTGSGASPTDPPRVDGVAAGADGVALDPCCCCWLVVGEGEACDDSCCSCTLDEEVVLFLCVPATTPPTMKMMRAITPMPHRVRYHGTFLTGGSWPLAASSRVLPTAPGLWPSVAGWFESDGASFGGVGARRCWDSSSRPTSYSPRFAARAGSGTEDEMA